MKGSKGRVRILLIGSHEAAVADERRLLTKLNYDISGQPTELKADLALVALDKDPSCLAIAQHLIETQALPVVFLVLADEPEVLEAARKIGVEAYIDAKSSPAIHDAIISTVLKLTASRKDQLSQQPDSSQQETTGNQMFQAVLDAIPQYICWKDRNSVFRGCNKNHSDLFGLADTASIIGKTDWDLHRVPEQIQKFIRDDQEVMETGKPKYRIIEKASYPDGSERWLETNKVALRDAAGQVYGIMIAYSDITEHKLIEDSLAHERYLMSALMDNSSDFIYFKDLKSRFLRTNRALAVFHDLQDCREMQGKTDFDFFRIEHAQQAFQDEQEIIRTGRPLQQEEINLRLNAPETWMLTEKLPLRDQAGQIIGTFGISRDITERKKAQELIKRTLQEKETLLRELYHRTKNNMGVIISLLNLQAQNFTNRRLIAAFNEAKDRIYAMALIHERLYETRDLSKIDLGSYLADLSARLFQSYKLVPGKVSFNPDIENILVSIDVAIPCGLVVNELISNALKHAFPGGRKGTIAIRLRQLVNDEIELVVSDDGVGVARNFDVKRNSLMGLQTVQALVQGQMAGQLEFDLKQGFSCRIVFNQQIASA